MDYLAGAKNPADAPSRRVDYVPQKGDAVLEAMQHTLLSPTHTERLFPLATPSPSLVVQVATSGTYSFPAPELLQQFKSAFRDDLEWREAQAEGDNSFTLQDDLVFHQGKLFVPEPLRPLILKSRHDNLVAGHPGRARTTGLVLRDYSWPGARQFIRRYVSTCEICQRIKAPRHKPYGLLQPLDIPDRPWKAITMDFIVKLPLSHRCDSIWVVCDRLTRAAHFIPTVETLRAPDLAWLFIDRIFRYHGVPESIVSDRGSLFVSKFWNELARQLQFSLDTSTAYHPRTDGLTERTNQTLETYLRAYCSYQQDDWVDYLPLAEFAYNNLENASTGHTPFYANYGFHPAFEPKITQDATTPAARDFADRLATIRAELQAELKEAQAYQALHFDSRASPAPEFEQGDLVWLRRRNIKTTRPSDKLDYRKLGPFPVIKRHGRATYVLELPPSLSRLYPVFHVSLLEPYNDPAWLPGRDLVQAPPMRLAEPDIPPDEINDILDSRKIGRRFDYFVTWKNKPATEASWIPLAEIPHSLNEALDRFHRRNRKAPRPLRFDNAQAPPSFPTASDEPPGPSLPIEVSDESLPAPAAQPIHFVVERSPSPPPDKQQLLSYIPPPQTTLTSGRISRPPQRYR